MSNTRRRFLMSDTKPLPEKPATGVRKIDISGLLHTVEFQIEKSDNINPRLVFPRYRDRSQASWRDGDGQFIPTAIELAASLGHIDLLRFLLPKGWSYETRSDPGDPLAFCLRLASMNGRVDMVRMLLGNGSNIEATDWKGSTPLQDAAVNGHLSVVRLLVEAGANVNAGESKVSMDLSYCWGTPALCRASAAGYEEIVKYLLENGAKIEFGVSHRYMKKLSDSALIGAAHYGQKSVVKILLAHGADVNLEHIHKGSALRIAAYYGHEAVCRLLIDFGADVNARTSEHLETPLIPAIEKNHVGIVKLLIERGADLNIPRQFNGLHLMDTLYPVYKKEQDLRTPDFPISVETPLNLAAGRGNEKIVQLLIEGGVDVNYSSIYDYDSALKQAIKPRIECRSEEVALLLLDAGSKFTSDDVLAAKEAGMEKVVKVMMESPQWSGDVKS